MPNINLLDCTLRDGGYINDWNGGFAPSQKQKNIRALHGAFLAAHPDARVLEISSKSMLENGPALSAFALAK